jgi:tripartite-type tricarboxylate transporter receptor subunit TctC
MGLPAADHLTLASASPDEFAQYLKDEYTRWGRIIREKGIKVE